MISLKIWKGRLTKQLCKHITMISIKLVIMDFIFTSNASILSSKLIHGLHVYLQCIMVCLDWHQILPSINCINLTFNCINLAFNGNQSTEVNQEVQGADKA